MAITQIPQVSINELYPLYYRPSGSAVFAECLKHEERSLISQNHGKIMIGGHIRVGRGVMIQHVERITIGKGVTLGKTCVIAANSFVTKDVTDNCIVSGNLAKNVKTNIENMPETEDCKEFEIYI